MCMPNIFVRITPIYKSLIELIRFRSIGHLTGMVPLDMEELASWDAFDELWRMVAGGQEECVGCCFLPKSPGFQPATMGRYRKVKEGDGFKIPDISKFNIPVIGI